MDLYLDDLSPAFWAGIVAVALFVAFRTWPSALDEQATVEERLRYIEGRRKFILTWWENFWGIALIAIGLGFALILIVTLNVLEILAG